MKGIHFSSARNVTPADFLRSEMSASEALEVCKRNLDFIAWRWLPSLDMGLDDVRQEAAIAFADAWEKGDARRSFEERRAFALKAANWRLNRFRRKQMRRKRDGQTVSMDMVMGVGKKGFRLHDVMAGEKDLSVQARERCRGLRRAVRQLPEPHRRHVLEYYFAGMTTREIGEKHGLTAQGIQHRLMRALEMLRRGVQGLDLAPEGRT